MADQKILLFIASLVVHCCVVKKNATVASYE